MKKFTAWMLLLVLCINLIPSFMPVVKASTSTWFVATTGSDTTGTGSISRPYATLRKAVDMSSNGDTICLRGGNYQKDHINPSGTGSGFTIDRNGISKSQPFTIMAYNHEKVVLDGTGWTINSYRGLLNIFSGRNNITLQDLYIENSSRDGLHVEGHMHDLNIINCSFINIWEYAAFIWTDDGLTQGFIENITVKDCYFYKFANPNGVNEGITFSGVKYFYFFNNVIRWCEKIIVSCGEGAAYGYIHDNNIQLNRTNTGEAIYIDTATYNGKTASHIYIYNNVIWGYLTNTVSAGGINICGEVNGGHLDNISIYNNVVNLSCDNVTDPSNIYLNGMMIKQQSHSSTSTYENITIMYNTIFVGLGNGKPIVIEPPADLLKDIVIANNILVTNETRLVTWQMNVKRITWNANTVITLYNNCYNYTQGHANLGKWGTIGTDPAYSNKSEATAIKHTPEFVDFMGGDFSINATSPCIDNASSLYTVSTDINGLPRPQGAGYDIGAYEYSSIGNVMITPNPQQIGGYLNISCNVTGNSGDVDEVWVNITSPDNTTQNYSMNPSYYLNQTYSLIGTYRFFIWANDTNGNSTSSARYMFQIIPKLGRAFLIGLIININDSSESIISFQAKLLLYIGLNPFSFNILSSKYRIFASRDTKGYIGTRFIIGVFNAAMSSEKSYNFPIYHRILNHLHWESQLH